MNEYEKNQVYIFGLRLKVLKCSIELAYLRALKEFLELSRINGFRIGLARFIIDRAYGVCDWLWDSEHDDW